MESWERNQLHAIFPADDLRLQQQQQQQKDGFLHQGILKANADNKKRNYNIRKEAIVPTTQFSNLWIS